MSETPLYFRIDIDYGTYEISSHWFPVNDPQRGLSVDRSPRVLLAGKGEKRFLSIGVVMRVRNSWYKPFTRGIGQRAISLKGFGREVRTLRTLGWWSSRTALPSRVFDTNV